MEPKIAREPFGQPDLLSGFSLEALPKAVISSGGALPVPQGTEIYLPSIPGSKPALGAEACHFLVEAGFVPVPHLAARSLTGLDDLKDRLQALSNAGARSLMLIAGDMAQPAGPFTSTLDVLATGLLAEHGFQRLGIAGHPDGLAVAEPGEVERALDAKADYAARTACELWIVTQFVFAAEPVTEWIEGLRQRGIDLPVRVGLAGPAKLHTLVAYAMRCGVGNSLRFLTDQTGSARKLLSRWSPDDLILDLAQHNRARPDRAVAGIHLYPFGGIDQTAKWLDRAGQRA